MTIVLLQYIPLRIISFTTQYDYAIALQHSITHILPPHHKIKLFKNMSIQNNQTSPESGSDSETSHDELMNLPPIHIPNDWKKHKKNKQIVNFLKHWRFELYEHERHNYQRYFGWMLGYEIWWACKTDNDYQWEIVPHRKHWPKINHGCKEAVKLLDDQINHTNEDPRKLKSLITYNRNENIWSDYIFNKYAKKMCNPIQNNGVLLHQSDIYNSFRDTHLINELDGCRIETKIFILHRVRAKMFKEISKWLIFDAQDNMLFCLPDSTPKTEGPPMPLTLPFLDCIHNPPKLQAKKYIDWRFNMLDELTRLPRMTTTKGYWAIHDGFGIWLRGRVRDHIDQRLRPRYKYDLGIVDDGYITGKYDDFFHDNDTRQMVIQVVQYLDRNWNKNMEQGKQMQETAENGWVRYLHHSVGYGKNRWDPTRVAQDPVGKRISDPGDDYGEYDVHEWDIPKHDDENIHPSYIYPTMEKKVMHFFTMKIRGKIRARVVILYES